MRITTDRHDASDRWLSRAAVALAVLFAVIGGAACWINFVQPHYLDFVSFWAAGRLALGGEARAAYDIAAHHAAEGAAVSASGLQPFPYPPPFLAVVAPFALTPYAVAFVLWIAVTGGLYAFAASRVVPLRYAMANPPVLSNLLIGQTGFLISGISILGLALIASNPFAAGLILGLLVLKPHIALLLPVAMLAGREWRVIAGAVLSASALLIGALLLFGLESYQGFLEALPRYAGFLSEGRWAWIELASPFALARDFGAPEVAALTFHAAVAIAAAVVAARAWWHKLDARVAILAAATLLVPPYLFTYDALLLIIPIGRLLREGRHPAIIAFVIVCCLIPVVSYFGVYLGPNLISIAAIICLIVLHWDKPPTNQADAPDIGDGTRDGRLLTSA